MTGKNALSIDPQLKIDEINKLEVDRIFGAILNYLDRFNPFTMAEDNSQQWFAAFDCCTVFGPKLIEDKNKRIAELEKNLENTRLVCDWMGEEWRIESKQNGHALNNANIMKIGILEAQEKLKDAKIAGFEEKLTRVEQMINDIQKYADWQTRDAPHDLRSQVIGWITTRNDWQPYQGIFHAVLRLLADDDRKIAEFEQQLRTAKERALKAERVIQAGWLQSVEAARKSGFEEMRQAAIEIVEFELPHEVDSVVKYRIVLLLKHRAIRTLDDLRNEAIAEALKWKPST